MSAIGKPKNQECTAYQWVLARQMATAVMCLNAPFCDGGQAEDPAWVAVVASRIADQTTKMSLEDAIGVLQAALKEVEVRSWK